MRSPKLSKPVRRDPGVGDKVAREARYSADPFPAPAFRAEWLERMPQ